MHHVNKFVFKFTQDLSDFDFSLSTILDPIQQASGNVIALTGAGASAASGIPTFRGKNGLYKGKDPMQLASLHGFRADPRLVWEWYHYRISLVKQAKPNPIHDFLALLEQKKLLRAVITQNVDNLHEQARSVNVLHLHGEIMKYHCMTCGFDGTWETTDFPVPPRCPRCHAILRPSVVWFGEPLPEHVLQESIQLARESSICLIIGTSGMVYPAASIPLIAKKNNALIYEFNIQESELSAISDYLFLGPSEVLMAKLYERLRDS